MATATINVRLGMEGTCCANTCKSGSDIVITNPIIKVIKITIKIFFDLVIMEPVRSPIGVMDNSTPTLKNSIPTIKRTAPIRKVIRILGGTGVMVKHSNNTITSIGNTAFKVSTSFSLNLELIDNYVKPLSVLFNSVYHIKIKNNIAKWRLSELEALQGCYTEYPNQHF